jgi:peptidoglycan/LPS O-acetylase OafA/YrhL
MRPDERRRMVGRTRVFGALGFIVAAVIAETLVRTQHPYFFALLAVTVGIPCMIVALSARIRN